MANPHQDQLAKDLRTLARRDAVLKSAVKLFGVPQTRKQRGGFATLARIVVDQQLSTKAAAAIWHRLVSTVGRVSAEVLLTTPEPDLRAAGLSGSKVKTLLALSRAVSDKSLTLRALARQPDPEVIASLTRVWGIGDWTAEIYMMFAMGRPDVWPVGDLALRTGWQIMTGESDRVAAEDLAAHAESWRPYRSAAAVLLWHVVGAAKTTKM